MPRSVHLFSRGAADQVSGGYLYNARLMRGLEALGYDVVYHGDGSAIDASRDADHIIVDGLVLADVADRLVSRAGNIVALLHMRPDRLAATGVGAAAGRLMRRSAIVVTGDSVRDTVSAGLGLPPNRVTCIPPGVDDDWRRKKAYAVTARKLLCLSNYVPGKGHARLIDTLNALAGLDWTLALYGNATLSPGICASVREQVAALGLTDRITVHEAIPHDAVNQTMTDGDLLLQFSPDESYSMVTAEALACGLPVLSHPTGAMRAFSRHGNIAYVDTFDRASTVRVLRGLMTDAGTYERLCACDPRPPRRWRQVAREFADVLERTR